MSGSAHRYTYPRSDGSTGSGWRAKWRGADGAVQSKRGFRTKAEALEYIDRVTHPVVVVELPEPRVEQEPPPPVVWRDPEDISEIERLRRELRALRARWTQEERWRVAAARYTLERERKAVADEWAAIARTVAAVESHVDLYRGGFTVYLLRDEAGEVVYVGQSTNVLGRLGQHARDPMKGQAATATIIRCESYEHMCDTEALLIDRLQPQLNILGVSDGAYSARAEGHSRAIALAGPAPASDWGRHRRSSHDRLDPEQARVFYE